MRVLIDTNILIEFLKNNSSTVSFFENNSYEYCISSITEMELYYGTVNKQELKKLEKFVELFDIIHLNPEISKLATSLIKKYSKSHSLDIPDALIAATAISEKLSLVTYNIKDFKYINALELVDI